MNDLLNTAFELMMLGMGTVFVFLVVLIGATKLMSSVVMLMADADDTETTNPALAPVPVNPATNPAQDPRLMAVISEAIKQHRAS